MAEDQIIQQQVPVGDPPAKRQLYDKLYASQLYTKSYEDFEKQYSTPDAVGKLFDGLSRTQLYTKSRQDFDKQYFSAPVTNNATTPPADNGIPKYELNFKMPKQEVDNTYVAPPIVQPIVDKKKEFQKTISNSTKASGNIANIINTNGEGFVRNKLASLEVDKRFQNRFNNVARTDNTAAPIQLPAEIIKAERDKLVNSFTPEQVAESLNDKITQRKIVEKQIRNLRKDGKDKDANQLEKDLYLTQVPIDEESAFRANKNAEKIGKGEYRFVDGRVIIPQGILDAIKTGFDERNKSYDLGHNLLVGSKENNIKLLNGRLDELHKMNDPHNPIPTPVGVGGAVGHFVGAEGISTVKGVAPNLIPGVGTAAAIALTAEEMGMRSYGDKTLQVYAEQKDHLREQHPDWSDKQIDDAAYDIAEKSGKVAGWTDAIVAGVLTKGVGGAGKLSKAESMWSKEALEAGKNIPKASISTFKKVAQGSKEFLGNTIKTGVPIAGAAGGGQVAKNLYDISLGIDKKWDEGVAESMKGMLLLHAMFHSAGAAAKLGKAGIKSLYQAFTKMRPEDVQQIGGNLVHDRILSRYEADQIIADIENHRQQDLQIPAHITETDQRLQIHDKIEEYNQLNQQLKGDGKGQGGLHPAFGTVVKEKIKKLEDDIHILSQPPEEQTRLLTNKAKELERQLAEDKAARQDGGKPKLDDREPLKRELSETNKQLKEVTEKVNSDDYKAEKVIAPHMEEIPGMLQTMAKQQPHQFLKFLADQAQGIGETGEPVAGGDTRYALKEMGIPDKLVDQAIEMFPAPKVEVVEPEPSKVSVIMPNETPKNEVVTIAPKEETVVDNPLRDAELEDKRKEIQDYDKLKKIEENNGLIVTTEKRIDNDYAPNDPEHEQTKAYQIEYQVHWSDIDSSSNPDTEKFSSIDEAYNAANEAGDYWNANSDHYKEIRPVLKEVWLDKNGNVYEETDNTYNFEEVAYNKKLAAELGGKVPSEATVFQKDFGSRDSNKNQLEAEVYMGLGANLEGEYKAANGQTYTISHTGRGKYSRLVIADKEGNQIGDIGLRISDHSYNPKNNSNSERAGDFISVEIANVNPTKNKFWGKHSMEFAGDASFEDVVNSVKERVQEIVDRKTENISEPINTEPSATEIKEPDALDVRESPSNGSSLDGGNAKPQEVTGESTTEKGNAAGAQTEVGGGRTVGISHERTNQLAREYGLPEYEGSPEKVKEWWEQARKRLQNPEELPKLLFKLRLNQSPDHVETLMMLDYIASLDAKLQSAPTPELLAEFTRAKDLANIAHRIWGKTGVAMQQVKNSENTLGSFLESEAASRGYGTLSQKELDGLKTEFEKGQAAKKAYEEGIAKLKIEKEDRAAENAVRRQMGVRKRANKTKEDFEAERKDIRERMREKIEKARAAAKSPDSPKAMGVGGRTKIDDLFLIAPEVAEMVRSYVGQGVTKLGDLVSKLRGELEDFEGLTDSEIKGLIAGEYAKKKIKKSDLDEQIADLKLQAALSNKLEGLLSGAEPKTQVAKKKRSEAVEALKSRIKEVEQRQKEGAKNLDQIRDKNIEEPADPFADQKIEGAKLKNKREYYLRKIKELRDEIKSGKYKIEKEERKEVKLDEKTQKYQDEYIDFLKTVEERRRKAEYDRLSKWEKLAVQADKLWNTKREAETSIDISYPFRQGVTLMFNPRHWDVAGKALEAMFRSVKSQKEFDRKLFELKQNPLFKEMEKAGVEFNEIKGDKVPEGHQRSYLQQIPFFGGIFKKSARAAAAFSNVARFERYAKLKRITDKYANKNKLSPEEITEMNEANAEWTNNLTGSGKMISFLESPKGQKWAGRIFYGAKLMASRFNMLNPTYYARMPKAVRVEALKDIGAFAGTMIATGLALKMGGADISFDPDSPDFLKAKWGNRRYDLTGGLGNFIRLYANIATLAGQAVGKQVGTVPMKELKKEGRQTGYQVQKFFRYKLAPNTGDITSLLFGEDALGREYDPAEFIKIYPMYVDDLMDAWKSEGALSLGTVLIPSLVGVGVQEYESKEKGAGGGAGASGRFERPERSSRPERPHR